MTKSFGRNKVAFYESETSLSAVIKLMHLTYTSQHSMTAYKLHNTRLSHSMPLIPGSVMYLKQKLSTRTLIYWRLRWSIFQPVKCFGN